MNTPSDEDQNSLHRVDIEDSGVDTGEDQKVTEWARSLGYGRITPCIGFHRLSEDMKIFEYLTYAQATFFYKAQQDDRKRLLDKVAKQLSECAYWGDVEAALDQIRKEEL